MDTQTSVSTYDTLPLLPIMVQLEADMNSPSGGIWREDYEQIRASTNGISNHPNIPKRQLRTIKKILDGKELKKFIQDERRLTLQYEKKKNRTCRSDINWQYIEDQLRRFIETGNHFPTQRDFAARFDVSDRSLRRHFPELCKTLTKKRREKESKRHEKIIQGQILSIQKTAKDLADRREPVTQATLIKAMSSPGYRHNKRVDKVLQETTSN